MGISFWYFYDIVAIAIVIMSIYRGYKKGFVRTILMTVGYLFAVVIAWTLSIFIADKVYDNFLQEKNETVIADAINSIDYSSVFQDELKNYGVKLDDEDMKKLKSMDSSEEIYNYVNKTGLYSGSKSDFDDALANITSKTMQEMFDSAHIPFSDSASNNILLKNGNKELTNIVIDILNGNVGSKPAELVSGYLRSVEIFILRVIFTSIISSVLMAIVAKFANLINVRQNRLTLATLNTHLGILAGIVSAIFYLYIFSNIIQIIVAIGKENFIFFNSDVIDRTLIFKYIYRFILNLS